MMRSAFGRRSFLRLAFGFVSGILVWPATKFANAQLGVSSPPKFAATLKAVVDTLIPDDGLSPSASALGVDQSMIQISQNQERIFDLLEKGCAWLDGQAGGAFAQLDEKARIDALKLAEAQPMSHARTFFVYVRKEAMRLYYAHPEASKGFVDYTPTPQPLGYPDYTQAPKSGPTS